MPKKGKKSRGKTNAEKIAAIPIEQISLLKGKEGRDTLIKYISKLRFGYNRRVASFAKRGVFSYAEYAFKENAPRYIGADLEKLTRNQLIDVFAAYQSFFESVTSNIQGIEKVNLAQDARIFGEVGGVPIARMNEDQRKMYWKLYDEYNNQHENGIALYTSESIQVFLGSRAFAEEEGGILNKSFDEVNVTDFLSRLESKLAEGKLEEDIRSVPNVYSGRGPYRQR